MMKNTKHSRLSPTFIASIICLALLISIFTFPITATGVSTSTASGKVRVLMGNTQPFEDRGRVTFDISEGAGGTAKIGSKRRQRRVNVVYVRIDPDGWAYFAGQDQLDYWHYFVIFDGGDAGDIIRTISFWPDLDPHELVEEGNKLNESYQVPILGGKIDVNP